MKENLICRHQDLGRRNLSVNKKAALVVEFQALKLYVQKLFQVKGPWLRN
jgi:hypothetical protein